MIPLTDEFIELLAILIAEANVDWTRNGRRWQEINTGIVPHGPGHPCCCPACEVWSGWCGDGRGFQRVPHPDDVGYFYVGQLARAIHDHEQGAVPE
jgi:hypothetical protein